MSASMSAMMTGSRRSTTALSNGESRKIVCDCRSSSRGRGPLYATRVSISPFSRKIATSVVWNDALHLVRR